jgi:uncharacterized membrane protein YkoI
MQGRKKTVVIGATIVGLGIGIAQGGAALASDDAEDERPITGSALEKASAVALAHLGGGRVADTEVGDEESYYEVEVTRSDGSSVDVQLDENFRVVGQEGDAPGDDEGSPSDE